MSDSNLASSSPSEAYSPTRRAFHLAVVYVLGGVISAAMAVPTVLYLFVPGRARKSSGFIDAGDVSQLAPGVPAEMSFQQSRLDGWRLQTEKRTAWVVKTPENKVVAFGPQCTHLGCAYHFEAGSKTFVCPCHTSIFGLDGKVISGPAPRPLDQYVSKVENNRLQIGDLKQSNA